MSHPDLAALLPKLPFVATHGIRVVSVEAGRVVVEMDFDPRFSTPPDLFPASVLGTLGDVAAVAACYSLLPAGQAAATIDYTLKMLAPARGDKMVARGRVLANGAVNSVGAADIFVVRLGAETMCATVLATTRNLDIRRPAQDRPADR